VFRRGYLRRMADCRQGTDAAGVPHPVLDPRDVKFFCNQGGYHWRAVDDPFAWRDQLPFVRVGLAELILIGGGCLLAAGILSWFWPAAAIVPLVLCGFVCWFFRNPRRTVPDAVGLVVSPADGKVVEIEHREQDPEIGGPSVTIGIFLSVFNVHLNRAPVAARVIELCYRPGKFLNALRAASARENEMMIVRLEEDCPPYRRMIVRQIAGAIARRIVCQVAPGERLDRGEMFGMIKFGSRTELVLPHSEGLEVQVRIGQKVQAGSTVLAAYRSEDDVSPTTSAPHVGGEEVDPELA
jgi:phosphatidylserine decarboxylase